MQMVMLVVDNPAHLAGVLEAWQAAGVSGATILESSGLQRVRRQPQVHARYAFGMARGGALRVEMEHYTVLAIVPDLETVHACLAAAERILGDLDLPNNGVFAAWELSVSKGVPGARSDAEGAR